MTPTQYQERAARTINKKKQYSRTTTARIIWPGFRSWRDPRYIPETISRS